VPVIEGVPLTAGDEGLPEYVVYETSYEAYPHILASGSIQRAAGATHITFSPVTVGEDGSESRLGSSGSRTGSDADIGIWVHLKTALEAEPSMAWLRTASGALVTDDEVPKSLWKKALARRPDVGLLFEDGEIRKEVPERLRGKGSKGKAKKGKGSLKSRGEDASGSASEE
jgi:2'-phosphotransferase